jgi:hypothetical protein
MTEVLTRFKETFGPTCGGDIRPEMPEVGRKTRSIHGKVSLNTSENPVDQLTDCIERCNVSER